MGKGAEGTELASDSGQERSGEAAAVQKTLRSPSSVLNGHVPNDLDCLDISHFP